VSLRVAVAALAVALLVTACGGGPSAEHKAVANYLGLVNSTENKLAGSLKAVTKANQDFARKQASPKVEAELVQSEQTMQKMQRELAAITPPPQAKHVHAMLLELVQREVALTHEVYLLSIFLPRYNADLQPMGAADSSLETELGRSAKGKAAAKALDAQKAEALTSYASIADGVVVRLRALDPPAVWRPAYEGQVSALVQVRNSGIALAQAIEANRAAAIPSLLRRFDSAALADQSLAIQKRQIAAVNAYDRKVNSLIDLARGIERERNRLQRVTT
jgi:hypothetical protein